MNRMKVRTMVGESAYNGAKHIYSNDGIQNFTVNDDGLYQTINAVTHDKSNKRNTVRLIYNHREDGIVNAFCDCPDHEPGYNLCEHCTAVLLKYMGYMIEQDAIAKQEKENEIKSGIEQTTEPLKQILTRRQARSLLPVSDDQRYGMICLIPHLIVNTEGFTLEFKIGIPNVKMYILKNIFLFGLALENATKYFHGKKLFFVHSIEMFEADTQPIVKFLYDWVQGNKKKYKHYSINNTPVYEEIKEIRLCESDLEAFLDACGDRPLAASVAGCPTKSWTTQHTAVKRKLRITRKKEGLSLSLNKGFSIIGKKEYLFFDNGIIYRNPRDQIEPIADFIELMDSMPYNTAFVGKDDLPSFVRVLLPVLETYCDCQKSGSIAKDYGIKPANFEIYLDMVPKKIHVTFQVVAVYGKEKYSVFDKETDLGMRDLAKECEVSVLVSAYSNTFDPEKKEMLLSEDDDLMFELLTKGIPRMQQVGKVYISKALKSITVRRSPRAKVGISMTVNLLELSMLTEDMSKEELAELLTKYDTKKKYYRLKSGNFVDMQDEGIQTLVKIKQNLGLTEKQLNEKRITVPKYRALYLDSELKDCQDLISGEDNAFRSLIRNMMTVKDNDFEIPPPMNGLLREYQKHGFLWLKTLKHNGFGGILADEMGLGKTLQVIAFLESEHAESDGAAIGRTLIITPVSLAYNWKSEFQQFAPDLSVVMVVGDAEERQRIIRSAGENDILLTSYEVYKRDIETYKIVKFANQIIDEAQMIKNYTTQIAKAVKETEAGFKLALTGTPIENNLSELWSLFDYLMPGFLYTYQKFREEFEIPIIQKKDKVVMKRLKKMIRPFVLRRLKKDVLTDLPDKLERNYFVELKGEQQKLYDAHVERIKTMLKGQTDKEFRQGKLMILSELTRLRQICCDPSLIYEDYTDGAAKMQLCIEIIRNAVNNGHKILLFSQFTSMLELIKIRLEEEAITFYTLTGETPKAKRPELVGAFNRRDDTQVFCISLKAGGTGLNLTSADIVIHFDPWWNQAAQMQATDRAHRIGQKNIVTVYKLIAKGTIEENIMKLQDMKRDFADQLLGGEGMASGSFTKEELLELLN